MDSPDNTWPPTAGPPVGLITWYSSSGPMVAAIPSWLAVVDGQPPELHAGCGGMQFGRDPFQDGADFVVNLPPREECSLLNGTTPEQPFVLLGRPRLLPARSVRAPLLDGCALQIECTRGRMQPGVWEPALAGDIVLMHRGGWLFPAADFPDFCTLRPRCATSLC